MVEEEIASFEASRRSPFSCKLPSRGFLETTPHVFILISGGGRSGGEGQTFAKLRNALHLLKLQWSWCFPSPLPTLHIPPRHLPLK